MKQEISTFAINDKTYGTVAYNRKHRMTPAERLAYENQAEPALVTEKIERR